MLRWTRRQFLNGLSLVGSRSLAELTGISLPPGLNLGSPARFAPTPAPPLFEQVPSAVSGITWRHVNGRSPEYYLPETTGAGCAFLDYDNDGWMDLYVVNDSLSDFFFLYPTRRNADIGIDPGVAFSHVSDAACGMAGSEGRRVGEGG